MVTTKEALAILRARGFTVPYPTIALWVREGRFEGAELDESNPRGAVWYIPRKAVESFEPPKRGAPVKAKTNSEAPSSDGRVVAKSKKAAKKGKK